MTIWKFCQEHTVNANERVAIIRYLAVLRYERTLKLLEE